MLLFRRLAAARILFATVVLSASFRLSGLFVGLRFLGLNFPFIAPGFLIFLLIVLLLFLVRYLYYFLIINVPHFYKNKNV